MKTLRKFAIIECFDITESQNPAHKVSQRSSTGHVWNNTSTIIEANGVEDAAARLLQFPAEDLRSRPFGEAAFQVVHRTCLVNSEPPRYYVCLIVVPI